MDNKLIICSLTIFLLSAGQCQEPELFLDMNNVYEYIPDPGKSVGKVHYLGTFQTTRECIQSCMSHNPDRCLTFTYYTMTYEGPFKGHCYGGIEEPLWSPIKMENVDTGRIKWPCRNDMDCSLNGKCQIGECECRKAWKGHRCDMLNLLPADRNTGYHYMENGKNISSWGGPVLRYKDGTYHMYVSEMINHCGINSWTLNSQLIHASSDSPTGTFKRQEVVRTPFATEPDLVRGPNGEFVLFWSDFKFAWPLCNCSDGSTLPSCQMPDAQFYCYMSYAMNPDGPWSTPISVDNPNPRGRGQDNNFAPVILKDGSLVGFSRWGKWGHGGSRIHLVTASDWKNASTYVENQEEVWPDLPDGGTEDPFMYLDENGYFHAIFHNMWPSNIQENCGGHAYSMDGKNWVYGGKAFDNHVVFTDGGSFTFTRRERPHFIFAEDGVTPVALTNGVQYGGKYKDASYTLLQPVAY